jgi:hypothetical protein
MTRRAGSGLSGRGAGYPAPPPQIPACGFPAPGSCRKLGGSTFGAWAAHSVSIREAMLPVTRLLRLCVRGVLRHRPLLPAGSLPSTSSDAAPRSLFGCFNGSMDPSDSSCLPRQLRLLDFLSWPGVAGAAAGSTRSPRFRRDPFVRDVASDPDRATVPCIAVPHMLPSTVLKVSAPATSGISWLKPTPHTITVYASPWSSPSTAQHSLPGGRYPLPGPDFHRLDRASFAWRTKTPLIFRLVRKYRQRPELRPAWRRIARSAAAAAARTWWG